METESYRIRTVSIEGGDQVGKGDAVLNMANYLSEFGENVSVLSYPMYALPIGMSIRKMLCSGQEDWKKIEGMEDVIGTKTQTEIAMAMFALNRLETLDYLSSAVKEGDIFLFDRSSFSNALTLAYHIFLGNVKEKEIEEEVDKALSFDNLFINELNLKNCILNLKTENTQWNASRGEGEDKYERKEVQDICDLTYSCYENKIGSGWKQVITKRDGKWVDRDNIRDKCVSFVSERVGINKKKAGSLTFIRLDSITSVIYPKVEIPQDILNNWENSTRINDKKGIYESSIKIGEYISNNLDKIDMTKEVKMQFKKILDKYPEIYPLLGEFAGKKFSDILVKTLNG